MKGEARQAAIGGDVLILLPDRLAEPVDLQMTGKLGQLPGMDQLVAESMQPLQQRRAEAGRGAEPGTPGGGGGGRDLGPPGGELLQCQRLADNRMAYLADLGDVLEGRVLEVNPGAEGTGNGDIHVLVDRGRDHEALVAAVVGGQIGAASAERDPQRAAYDDHV